ncbi:hypothetical protein EDF21_3235 [Frigoribacterium sp. PhB118]|nr:hypothetical protein EDF21_3235 [Frigoribacterium sp. PhB118]
MTTPLQEIQQTGKLGTAGYELFRSLVRKAARRYPPPPGYGSWSDEATREWLQEFFAVKGPQVVTKLAALAHDEISLANLAYKAVSNALVDDARKTVAGRMAKRLSTLLPPAGIIDATRLRAGDPAWTLPSNGDAVFTGDWETILTAPALTRIGIITELNASGPTSSKNAAVISEAARIILETARGAVRARDLATAIVELFELDDPDAYLQRDDDVPETPSTGIDLPGERIVILHDADLLWSWLTNSERLAFAYLGEPLAVARRALPSHTDLASAMPALVEKVASIVKEHHISESSILIVQARSHDAADQTPGRNQHHGEQHA